VLHLLSFTSAIPVPDKYIPERQLPKHIFSATYLLFMTQTEPLVSVILPVCNASRHLSACLESILKQKHQRIEVIAIDDKSIDASVKILKAYRRRDRRIKVFTNVKRYGLAITLNRALKQAQESCTQTSPR
jgi:cellulose synthase/poly-beta-1,6-N-acetylglucosamine synthase-like glycosyltransferase